ncbi:hypothetical protein V6N13_024513 [Hibiscus sabdariffa]
MLGMQVKFEDQKIALIFGEKRGIPKGLNSSLWSTTPSTNDLLYRDSSSSINSFSSVVPEPIVQPSNLVLPPTVASSPQSAITSPKSKFRDGVDKNSNDTSNDNDQNASSFGVSPNDISHQAQLLTKLSKKVVKLRELQPIVS